MIFQQIKYCSESVTANILSLNIISCTFCTTFQSIILHVQLRLGKVRLHNSEKKCNFHSFWHNFEPSCLRDAFIQNTVTLKGIGG
jgi:hypothetical protein